MAFNPLSPEAPKQLADLVDRVVQTVRRTVTTRAVKATNALVYGMLAAFALLVALVLFLVLSIRAGIVYLTWDPGTLGAWVIGVIALVGAAILLVALVRSKKLLMLLGGTVAVTAGARWAIFAGDASIDHNTAVWITYVVIGGLFLLGGSFLMAKRLTPEEE